VLGIINARIPKEKLNANLYELKEEADEDEDEDEEPSYVLCCFIIRN